MSGAVRGVREGRIGVITLDRAETSNAIDIGVLGELEAAVAKFEATDEVRVIVVTGSGRSFSAGGDIKAMRDLDQSAGRVFVERGQEVMNRIARSHLVSIAAVNGHALGGGAELALACDIRIAADTAVIGFPEVSLGLYPAWGGTQRASRLIGPGRAKLIMLTGDTLSAAEAERIGLFDQVVPAATLLAASIDVANRIAANSPIAVRQTKMAIATGLDMPLPAALRLEIEGWMANLAGPDRVEGLSAFLEKRKPRWHDG